MKRKVIDTLVLCTACMLIGFIAAQNYIQQYQKVTRVEGNTAFIECFGNVHSYGIGEEE